MTDKVLAFNSLDNNHYIILVHAVLSLDCWCSTLDFITLWRSWILTAVKKHKSYNAGLLVLPLVTVIRSNKQGLGDLGVHAPRTSAFMCAYTFKLLWSEPEFETWWTSGAYVIETKQESPCIRFIINLPVANNTQWNHSVHSCMKEIN